MSDDELGLDDEPGRPSFSGSQIQAEQDFSIARGEFQLKADREAHKQREASLDSAGRRQREQVGFWAITLILAGGLVAGGLLGTLLSDTETRRFWQSVVTLLLGTVAGGIAGYFGGRAAP